MSVLDEGQYKARRAHLISYLRFLLHTAIWLVFSLFNHIDYITIKR